MATAWNPSVYSVMFRDTDSSSSTGSRDLQTVQQLNENQPFKHCDFPFVRDGIASYRALHLLAPHPLLLLHTMANRRMVKLNWAEINITKEECFQMKFLFCMFNCLHALDRCAFNVLWQAGIEIPWTQTKREMKKKNWMAKTGNIKKKRHALTLQNVKHLKHIKI